VTKPTEVPVTIDDIARAVGVHPGTVSRALRGISGKVSKDKRAEIEKVARDLGYQPNTIAASLRTKRTNIAAIVVPDLSKPALRPHRAGARAGTAEAPHALPGGADAREER
jgi:LacI family transcriptional regulator